MCACPIISESVCGLYFLYNGIYFSLIFYLFVLVLNSLYLNCIKIGRFMNIIKLKKGDTIGILALSGEIKKKSELLRAKEYFEQKGYKIVLSENVFDRKRYLAGSDEDKVSQLHKFFEADNIDAILCARGGYGAIRLLNKIDYDIIRKNPKIFAGYSDVTALSAMFYKKSGLVTFQAPMALGDFGGNEISAHTERSFFSILKGEKTDLKPDFRKLRVYREGGAEGAFWGGNLSTVVSLDRKST